MVQCSLVVGWVLELSSLDFHKGYSQILQYFKELLWPSLLLYVGCSLLLFPRYIA